MRTAFVVRVPRSTAIIWVRFFLVAPSMHGNSMRVSLQFTVWLYTGKLLLQIYAHLLSNNRANFMRLEKLPQRPPLSRCEAFVSWNLARPALSHPLRAPLQYIRKPLQQRRLP